MLDCLKVFSSLEAGLLTSFAGALSASASRESKAIVDCTTSSSTGFIDDYW